jgi:RND family efflux transporter MFP subunit
MTRALNRPPTVPRPTTILLALGTMSCGSEPPPEAPVVRPVRFAQVFATGGARVRRFSGVSRAGVESRLSFRVRGAIQEVAVAVGDSVRAGQLIARLDPTDYRLELQRAQASLRQAEAEARNAETSYRRVQALWEANNATTQDLDAGRSAFESAQAAVQSLENQVELATTRVGYTRLTAPMPGAIAEVPVEVSENVDPGETVARLSSGSTPEVEVAMPGVLIRQIRRGDPVTVTFDALGDEALPGRVTEVGVSPTGTATTFPVRVALEATGQTIRSGMAAEVAFAFAATRDTERILVPPVAVIEDAEGRFVWVVTPAESGNLGTVARRAVRVGELTSLGLEIVNGLEDGDAVVTAGVSLLTEGLTVRLLPAWDDS